LPVEAEDSKLRIQKCVIFAKKIKFGDRKAPFSRINSDLVQEIRNYHEKRSIWCQKCIIFTKNVGVGARNAAFS